MPLSSIAPSVLPFPPSFRSPRAPLSGAVLVVAASLALASVVHTRPAYAQTPATSTIAPPTASRDSAAVVPTARAVRTRAAIRIDGRLDEAAWATAPVTDRFTQIDPHEGAPASQRTEVRVLFDDDALYVGVRLHDDGPITMRLGRRDMSLGDSDWFGLMLDSYHDHRTAFGFDVNPAGVQRDEVKTIEHDDNSWDAVWDVATTVDSGGWIAEYRVPFSQLRFSRDQMQTWGVQFERIIGRNREYAVSTFIPKSVQGGVPRYGHLEGLEGLTSGKRLELLPYTVSRAESIEPGPNPYRHRHEAALSAGLDLRYRLASNLTLNATLNPDFGQVEVDPAVVNLGVYETFFQEKRPFFLEGNEIFDFGRGGTSGGQLFYTRRIGRAPTLGLPTPESDAPPTTTILGAAKVSGKIGGWSVGSLTAVTDRETGRYRDAGGIDRTQVVEPMSEYFVGRARRESNGGQLILGGVVTIARRELGDSLLASVFRANAVTAGVDFRREFAGRSWAVRGDAGMSRVAGTADAIALVQTAPNHYFQRPDASHLDFDPSARSLSGYSTNAALAKQGGEHWRGEIAGALTSSGYEVNDLGFAYRTDRRDAQAFVQYLENRPGELLRRWSSTAVIRSEHNFANEPILTIANLNLFGETPAYWSGSVGLQRLFRAFDDRLTRGGPIAVRPASAALTLQLNTDRRRDVSASSFAQFRRGEQKMWSAEGSITTTVRPSSRWTLSVGPGFARAHTPAQYVTSAADASYTPTYGRRYVFAPLDQTELGIETRLNVTFTPKLSLETYLQPLISSGSYGDPIQLVAARTYDFVPYGAAAPDRDFNFRSLRGNAVLRWEWRAGSTMYLAWQQQRSSFDVLDDFDLARDRRALFASVPDNVVILKVNYWITP